MKLQEVFDQLSAGEFSQLNIGGAKLGGIQEDNYPTVVAHITLGLTALYRRFNLKQGRIGLLLQPNQEIYQLHSKYAISNTRSQEAVKFIKDSLAYPFKDDIIKIEQVSQDGELPLNDAMAAESVFTLKASTLQVPSSLSGELEIKYRANHPSLVAAGGYINPELELELEPAYLQALLYFVASRAHNPVGMVNEFNAGNNWFAKYEKECQQLVLDSTSTTAGSTSRGQTRFERGGWV